MASEQEAPTDLLRDLNRSLNEISLSLSYMRQLLGVTLANLDLAHAAKHFGDIVDSFFDGVDTEAGPLAPRVKSISDTYRGCLRDTASRPDWSVAANRRAYIARFFPVQAYMVYRGLQASLADHARVIEDWAQRGSVRLCCVGGGPGSDAVGAARFLRDSGLFAAVGAPVIRCTVLDLYVDWQGEWGAMRAANPDRGLPGDVAYLRSDMASKVARLCGPGLAAVRSADLVTVIKSFSTVAAFLRRDPEHGNQLRQVFREARPGALVLYVDNIYRDQHEEFRGIARAAGVRDCLFEWHGRLDMPALGASASVRRIAGRVGVEPMTGCSVSVMLLRK